MASETKYSGEHPCEAEGCGEAATRVLRFVQPIPGLRSAILVCDLHAGRNLNGELGPGGEPLPERKKPG